MLTRPTRHVVAGETIIEATSRVGVCVCMEPNTGIVPNASINSRLRG
jgi:hypothetical protein